jgi:hypothetical protein
LTLPIAGSGRNLPAGCPWEGETVMAQSKATIDIGKETWNRAVAVAPDFWIVATRHRPGMSRHSPEINNRCLIFRLRDASAGNAPVLLVANATDLVAIPEVKRIAEETRTPVRYLIAAGAGHSLHLKEWHDALPDITVLAGPVRIPRIAAGKQLAASPRFKVFDQNDPLPMFHGQLEAVNFHGLGGFKETMTPKEGGKDSALGIIKVMAANMPPKDPHDELWLFHLPTRTVIGGENLGWNLTKADLAGMGFMFRMMMKAEQVYVMTGARPVRDKATVASDWRTVLAWPAENVLSYHDSIGTGQIGGGQAALKAAVEKAKQM